MVDRKGLITNSRGDELPSHKKMFARKDGPNIKVTDPHPLAFPMQMLRREIHALACREHVELFAVPVTLSSDTSEASTP